MKAVFTAALLVLIAGILVMRGEAPDAVGQSAVPVTPGVNPGFKPEAYGVPNPQSSATQLAKQYAKATKEEDKKEIKKQLSDLVTKEFDQLAQRQQAELEVLEKQVADLKTVLKKRKESKDSIVERRLEQLILDAEGLGWGSPKHSDPSYYPFPSAGPSPKPNGWQER